jgi:hypothetical protein
MLELNYGTNLEYVGIELWNNLCHCIILQLGQNQLQRARTTMNTNSHW